MSTSALISSETHLIPLSAESQCHVINSTHKQGTDGRLFGQSSEDGTKNSSCQSCPLSTAIIRHPLLHMSLVADDRQQVEDAREQIRAAHQTSHSLRVNGMDGKEKSRHR